MRTRLLTAALVTALLLVAACSDDDDDAGQPAPTDAPAGATDPAPGDPATGGEVVVSVTMAFDPATVEVSPGTTVRWESAGGLPHTVTSTSGPMDFDETLPDGGSVTVTFDESGTHEYACTIHPSMTGTIVVS